MSSPNWFDKLISLLSSGGRRLTFIAFFVAAILWALGWVIDVDAFGIPLGITNLHNWLGVIALIMFLYFIGDRLYAFGAWWFGEWRATQQANKERSQRISKLYNLTYEERSLLRKYIIPGSGLRKRKTVIVRIDDGVVLGLVKEDILYRATEHNPHMEAPFNIQSWAYEYLCEHLELLDVKSAD